MGYPSDDYNNENWERLRAEFEKGAELPMMERFTRGAVNQGRSANDNGTWSIEVLAEGNGGRERDWWNEGVAVDDPNQVNY